MFGMTYRIKNNNEPTAATANKIIPSAGETKGKEQAETIIEYNPL